MTTLVATYGYTKDAVKQRRRILRNKTSYHHLMMSAVLKFSRSAVMATKLHS